MQTEFGGVMISSLTKYLKEQIPEIDRIHITKGNNLFDLDIFMHTNEPVETGRLIWEVCAFYTQREGLLFLIENRANVKRILIMEGILIKGGRKIAEITIHNTTHTRSLRIFSVTVVPIG